MTCTHRTFTAYSHDGIDPTSSVVVICGPVMESEQADSRNEGTNLRPPVLKLIILHVHTFAPVPLPSSYLFRLRAWLNDGESFDSFTHHVINSIVKEWGKLSFMHSHVSGERGPGHWPPSQKELEITVTWRPNGSL